MGKACRGGWRNIWPGLVSRVKSQKWALGVMDKRLGCQDGRRDGMVRNEED
jgi:hypothetical protein